MMENISGKSLDKLPYLGIRKVADLAYMDGPLLSLFRDANERNYIYYWYETDGICNRWLVFQISSAQLEGYLNQDLPLLEVIKSPQAGKLFIVDIDSKGHHLNVLEAQLANLPADSLPQEGVYFDPIFSDFEATSLTYSPAFS